MEEASVPWLWRAAPTLPDIRKNNGTCLVFRN